jgi:hypothetical protein
LIKTKFAVPEIRILQKCFHPKKIFESGYFPEMKVMKNRKVFAEIIDFFFLTTVEISNIIHETGQICFKPELVPLD